MKLCLFEVLTIHDSGTGSLSESSILSLHELNIGLTCSVDIRASDVVGYIGSDSYQLDINPVSCEIQTISLRFSSTGPEIFQE